MNKLILPIIALSVGLAIGWWLKPNSFTTNEEDMTFVVRLNDRAITVRPENCICLKIPLLRWNNGFVACEHPPLTAVCNVTVWH